MIKTVLILCILTYARSQKSDNTETCSGQTTNNYYYTKDEGHMSQAPALQRANVLQGPPGKSGASGHKGEKGAKGEIGAPNNTEIDKLLKEMNTVKTELKYLKDKLDENIIYPSCAHVKGSSDDNGFYQINPDPSTIQPFYVYCNFSTTPPKTIIQHDSMNEIETSSCEPSYCYNAKIIYEASLRQIISVINNSTECSQFIKFRCIKVMLSDFGAWLSRDGVRQHYWGGASNEQNGFCACGQTQSCSIPKNECNCDRNLLPETSDEGFLTDKTLLPVTGLLFGDSGSSDERGWHTLGPLICS